MNYLVAVFLSTVISLIATKCMIPLAKRIGIVDHPDPNRPQKDHKQSTVLLGGVGVSLSFFITLFILTGLRKEIVVFFIAAFVIMLLGISDDRSPLNASKKILFQTLAALFLIIFGVKVGWFHSELLNNLITIIWIVGITNSLNLMDNIDGAAGGVSLIAAIYLSLIASFKNYPLLAIICAALAGGCFGFLRYNLLKRPAQIFLGDGGSMFLGLSLAWLSLIILWQEKFSVTSAIIPVLILSVPIFDTTLATVLRIINKKPIYLADRSNLTYRLVEFIPKNKVVFVEYLIAITAGAIGVSLLRAKPFVSLIIFFTVISVLTVLGIKLAIPFVLRNRQSLTL
jgi:UDP-GlcNAc:undecaprenyl-phosphate GlcNAc-1-phosphate transferase